MGGCTQVRPAHKHLTLALGMSMPACAPLLSWLFMLHSLNKQLNRVPYTEFHNRTASDVPDSILAQQYNFWRSRGARVATAGPGNAFSLCEYPFLLTPDAKRRVLRLEAQAQQIHSAQSAAQVRGCPLLCTWCRVAVALRVGWQHACANAHCSTRCPPSPRFSSACSSPLPRRSWC